MNKLLLLVFLAIIIFSTGCSTMKYEVTSSIEKEGFQISQYKSWLLDTNKKSTSLTGSMILYFKDIGFQCDGYYATSQLNNTKSEDFLILKLKENYGFVFPPRFDPVGHRYIFPNPIFYAPKSTDIIFMDSKSKRILFKFNTVRGIFKGVYDIYDEEDKKYYRTYDDFVMNKFYKALSRYNVIPPNSPRPFVITSD